MLTRLSFEAGLYWNPDTYEAPAWQEVLCVKDVTLNLETGEADVTTRGNAGWRAILATLKDASLEFELVWDPTSAAFIAIRTAFFTNGAVELAALDADITTSGAQGLRAAMAITNFSRSEPLEEAITVSVTAKPTYSAHPPEWMEVP